MPKKALQPSDLPKPANFSRGIEAAGSWMIFVAGNVGGRRRQNRRAG